MTQPSGTDWREAADALAEAARKYLGSRYSRQHLYEIAEQELSAAIAIYDAAAKDDGSRPTQAAIDVQSERLRQIEAEGWSYRHDDEHCSGELANATACYAASERIFVATKRTGRWYKEFTVYEDAWPWADEWWKPKDRRSDLVRAGALILAEIERLDRSAIGDTP